MILKLFNNDVSAAEVTWYQHGKKTMNDDKKIQKETVMSYSKICNSTTFMAPTM